MVYYLQNSLNMAYKMWYFYLNMGFQNIVIPIWYLFSKRLKIWNFQYGIFFMKIKNMEFSTWHFILEIFKHDFLKYGKKKPMPWTYSKFPCLVKKIL